MKAIGFLQTEEGKAYLERLRVLRKKNDEANEQWLDAIESGEWNPDQIRVLTPAERAELLAKFKETLGQ